MVLFSMSYKSNSESIQKSKMKFLANMVENKKLEVFLKILIIAKSNLTTIRKKVRF